MAEKIYFQWQNDALRKTIYPARDMKLRHFLLYYKEIDLWAEYKDKKIDDIPKEKAEYEEVQKRAISDAYRDEQNQRKYFLTVTADADSKEGKNEVARLIDNLHKEFKTWFGKYEKEKDESARDRKEKIFVTMRIAEWEEHRKVLKQKIAKKKSLLSDSNATNRDIKTKELEVLENMFRSLESELEQLKALVSAQNKLEKRKEEFAKRVKENSKKKADILRDLEPLEKQIEKWEAEREKINAAIARLSSPPKLDDALAYFSGGDIYDKLSKQFGEGKWKVHEPVLDAIIVAVRDAFGDVTGSFRKEVLPYIAKWRQPEKKDPTGLLQWIKSEADKFQRAQKKLAKTINALEDGAKSMRALPIPQDTQEAEVLARRLGDRLATINILS